MGNRLKKVFSNEKISYGGTLHFRDQEAYKSFLEALEKVQKEGATVKLGGVTAIDTSLKNGDGLYPIRESADIIELFISPSVEEFSLEVDTESGRKKLLLERYSTVDGFHIRTAAKAIIFMELFFEKDTEKITFHYRVQPQFAGKISEVMDACLTALAFLDRLFKKEEEIGQTAVSHEDAASIGRIKKYFKRMISCYRKADFVAGKMGLEFNPGDMKWDEESLMDLEEIYFLLTEKKAVRLNGKLTGSGTAELMLNLPPEELKPGGTFELTFKSRLEYDLWGSHIILYAANLLTNAVVKEIVPIQDNKVRIFYAEEDSKQMYISYRGFLTEEEASEELKELMNHKELYTEALTLGEYL